MFHVFGRSHTVDTHVAMGSSPSIQIRGTDCEHQVDVDGRQSIMNEDDDLDSAHDDCDCCFCRTLSNLVTTTPTECMLSMRIKAFVG